MNGTKSWDTTLSNNEYGLSVKKRAVWMIGIVSRCDLLSVFLRPDEDIAREVHEMLTQIPLADPAGVTARVQNGVVTLAGHHGSAEQNDLSRIAVRLTWDIDGVVGVNRSAGTPFRPPTQVPAC